MIKNEMTWVRTDFQTSFRTQLNQVRNDKTLLRNDQTYLRNNLGT